MRKALVLGLILVIGTPALAAWVGGDVTDVASASTIRVLDANGVDIGRNFYTVMSAYIDMDDGYTMLMGPGNYTFSTTGANPSAGDPRSWSKSIILKGSGSGEDPASNTVWTGTLDANNLPTSGTFLLLAGLTGYTIQDFRLANSRYHGFMLRDTNNDENLTEQATNFVFDNMAFVNLGAGATPGGPDAGLGDAILLARTADGVTVRNSLFDGDGPLASTNGLFGLRLANGGIQNTNILVEGNTFQNMRAGIGFNGYKADTIRVLNNQFTNISEFPGDGSDGYNSWGNAGIVFYPRRNSATTTDAWVKDVVISGNTFQDCGYLGDEPGNTNPHVWEDTLIHDAGIGFTLASGTTVENVMIRNNTFLETPADGEMERAINIVVSDANAYTLGGNESGGMTWTGLAGTLKNVVVDTNTYAGVNAIRAIQWSGGAVVDSLGQPDLYVKNANGAVITGINMLGDVDNDGDIDGYDITNLDEDLNGDGTVDDDDKVYLLTVALKTQIGDFNLDGRTDGLDFLKWQTGFNKPGTEDFSQGNCTGGSDVWDSDTDGLDFLKWQADFRAVSWFYPSSGAAVPEPATLALLALGGLALPRRRR